MDSRSISLYLSRILSGYYFVEYQAQRYKIKYPDINIKYEADILAEEEYDKVKYNGWHTKDSIVHQLVSMGIWPANGDLELSKMEKQIEDYKVDLYKNALNLNKTKQTRKKLDSVRKSYDRSYAKRHAYDHITVEGYCDNIRNEYLLVNSIYDRNDKLFFKNNNEYTTFNHMSFEISRHNIDISDFKKIARSDQWRNYWSANSRNIFSKPVIEWTDEQKTLVVITKMYDSARESPESPAEHIYEDDDMFDGWMISQRRENEKTREQNRVEKGLSGKLGKANEIFLMANSKEEAKNIYSMNDDQSRGVIRERESFIKNNSKKEIRASELPDAQRDIMMQNNEKRKAKG